MNYINRFILSCFKHEEHMRASTLYHLLKGKKTASTLTYGYFYQLLPYYYLYPHLEETDYQQILRELVQEECLFQVEEGVYRITDTGMILVAEQPIQMIGLDKIRYWKYDISFWQKILFITQIFSEKQHGNARYWPIESNPYKQQIVKQWLGQQADDVIVSFYKEWVSIVQSLPEERELFLTYQLVGHDMTGQTLYQLGQERGMSSYESEFVFLDTWHSVMTHLSFQPDKYPLFLSLLALDSQANKKDTTEITFDYFSKGLSIHDIGVQRQLKNSTITDHILEYYLTNMATGAELFLTEETKEAMSVYYSNHPEFKHWRFKECHSVFPKLSFYQFRFYQYYLTEQEGTGWKR